MPSSVGLKLIPILWAFFVLFAGPTWAQPSPEPTREFDSAVAEERLTRVAELLEKAAEEGAAEPYRLRELQSVLRRQLTLGEKLNRARESHQEAIRAAEEYRRLGLPEQAPYGVALLDEAQQKLENAQQQNSALKLGLASATKARNRADSQLKDLQKDRRRLLEKLEADPDRATQATLEQQQQDLDLAIEVAQETSLLRGLALEVVQEEIETAKVELETRQSQVKAIEANFRFDKESLEQELARQDETASELEDALRGAQSRLDESEAKLRELDQEASELALEAQEAWVQTHLDHVRLLEEQAEDHDDWAKEARSLTSDLKNRRGVLNAELSQIRTQLSDLITGSEEDESLTAESRQKVEALIYRQRLIEKSLEVFRRTELLAERLLGELKLERDAITPEEQWSRIREKMTNFWNFELYTIGDRAVTVRKLFVAILVLGIGVLLVRRGTHVLAERFLTRLPISDSSRVNLERFLRYLFTFLVFLFALDVVNIPLTIFTFLGGAGAIAIGFGAQNILNNFISGLILLVEKPVKIGDLIDVDGTIGFVEEIGARSTRVRLPVGIHVILPNSLLLENKVTNWTLRDNRIRTQVGVGVAYGSPTKKVVELLKEAAQSISQVSSHPEPVVLFRNFGDSSLDFEVLFWISASTPMDPLRVEHEVRMKIDELFREHGIEIPFPQRDLNLDRPIRVALEGAEAASKSKTEAKSKKKKKK